MIRKLLPIFLCAVWVNVCLAAEPPGRPDRPNIIFFIADDISWNDYGCYGNPAARTPNIDKLASQGLRFTQAYLTASSCSPSRSSIITGRYPHNNGKASELHREIAGHLPWFPELLRQSGYYTALVGKNHMRAEPAGPGQQRPKAFDLVDAGRVKGNRGGHGKWVQTLKNRPKDKPFFFWFASFDAHRDWEADTEWNEKYGPMHRPEDVVVPPFLSDDPATRQDLASYYNEVTRFDYFIGQVVDELHEEQIAENTLLFVLADNGRPFPRAKTRLHDSGMKTALVAHWPKGIRQSGVECPSLVSVIDLAPTVLELAGVEIPPTFQGVSMVKLFKDPSASIRRFAFSEHNWHDYEAHGRSVRRDDGLLLIRNFKPQLPWQGPADSVRSPSYQRLRALRDANKLTAAQQDIFLNPRPEVELYDTHADPHQLRNLASDSNYREAVEQLQAVLQQWIEQTGDSVPDQPSKDAFDRETGEKLAVEQYYGTPAGADRQAESINRPGPR